MVVKALIAHIVCPECGHKFEYSARVIHNRIEAIYNLYLSHLSKKCSQCGKADMVVRDIKCTVKYSKKDQLIISWKCLDCGTTWQQFEYLDKNMLANGKSISQLMPNVICPNMFCMKKTNIIVTAMTKRR